MHEENKMVNRIFIWKSLESNAKLLIRCTSKLK